MDRTAVMSLAAMRAQDWAALSDLLDQALDLPPAEREAWLHALDGEHLIHREALRALLATQAEIETGDFLADLPALPGVASEAGEARAGGQLVGAYRLIERIGRGGMGEVWLAERADGTVRRQVALKLPHAVWGDAFTERLVREREILAALDHAHIARLYDAGVDAHGRPFLAMAYVAGQPIDVYCRERALPLRSRVALLLQVAAAVAHAHARLVVHRDLKPGNILVGADGNVVLLDFGIAKLLDGDQTRDTALTAVSGRALTLDYASPEQSRGEPLGTASDIYSLAVVAYELLAGGRPYRLARGSAAELEEAIASAQAPRASDTATDTSTRRQLRGDLDAILNKALKKRPEERYATMDAFAADLRRWRDGEPVQARPDSAGYRMAKFIGRHRLQVAAGGVVMLALAGGASVALWQAHEARLAAAQARTEAATAKAVQGFMESVFISNSANQADPERARATTARELLDRGAERIEKDLAQAPEAQLRLYELLGEMYFHMALNDRSLALRRSGAALAARHFGAGSLEAINASVSLAKTLAEVGDREASLKLLLQADEALRARGQEDALARMEIDTTLAYHYFNSDPPQGLARARRAAAIARQQPPSQGSVGALHMLGEAANATGNLVEARDALAEALARIDSRPDETVAVLPLVLSTLGDVYARLGQLGDARATLSRAYDLAQRGSDPYTLHIAGLKLSRFLVANGRARDAIESGRAAAAWAQSLKGDHEFGAGPAVMIGSYGRVLLVYGDARRALAYLDDARQRLPTALPDVLGPFLATHAEAMLALGRTADAAADLDQAAALIGDRVDRNTESVRAVRRRYWVAVGKAQDALADFEAHAPKVDQASTAFTQLRRQAEQATLLQAVGRHAEAHAAASAVLAAISRLPEQGFSDDVQARMTAVQGQALLSQGRPADALPVLQQALALHRAAFDAEHSPEVAAVRAALATAQRRAP